MFFDPIGEDLDKRRPPAGFPNQLRSICAVWAACIGAGRREGREMTDCRMLGVDVDGTLMDYGRIDPADVSALHDAAAAGMLVCLCTGRTWLNVELVWRRLDLPQPWAPVICVGGAVVVEPQTGRTLYSRPFDRPTAAELAQAIGEMGYTVMALVDAWREGFDYLIIGPADIRGLYKKFFAGRELRTRRVDRLDGPDLPATLRISLLADSQDAEPVARELGQRFAGGAEVQAIHLRHNDLHIVEAFRAGTNKFAAMLYVAQGCGIPPQAMAGIGDDHNDLAMLNGVGVSATTADAPSALREAADMVLAPRGRTPVAQFVRRLLADRTESSPPPSPPTARPSRSSSAAASGIRPAPPARSGWRYSGVPAAG